MPSFSCTITGPNGTIAIPLAGVYKFDKNTRENRQVSHRKIEVNNPFVEGAYMVHSVRENIIETIGIYVYATSSAQLRSRIDPLTDAFDQVRYTVTFKTDTATETWTCMTADYTIDSRHEFQHQYMALIKANVPRLPKVIYS